MVIVKQHFTEMSIGTISQQQMSAFESFMNRRSEDITGLEVPAPVVDDLSISSTGYNSPPFVSKIVKSTYDPNSVQKIVHVEQVFPEQLVPETLHQKLTNKIASLTRKQCLLENFCIGFDCLNVPAAVVEIILMKLNLIHEKNGKKFVDVRQDTKQLVETMVSVMTKVDLMNAIIGKLQDGTTVHWSSFMNPRHVLHIKSGLLKDQKKEVFDLLNSLGFVNPQNNFLILPSQWASLSVDDCCNMVWNSVSQSKITTSHPPSKPKKCGRSDQSQSEITMTHPPSKGKKRGRSGFEEATQNQDKWQGLSVDELLNIFFTNLFNYVLSMRGFAVSLTECINSAFLALSPNELHQLVDFLSSGDTIWILQRILMEIPHLTLLLPADEDVFLYINKQVSDLSFDMNSVVRQYHLFSMEAVMHHQDINRRIHEERVREEQEREHVRLLNEEFISLLWELWKKKDMETFFIGLNHICPEFDSKHTNWSRLKKCVVNEFRFSIYNATTRAHHNGSPCETPLQDFLEYCVKSGVFPMRMVRQRIE